MKQYLKTGLLSLFFSTCVAFFIIVLCIIGNPINAAGFFTDIRFDGMAYASYSLAYRNSDKPADIHLMMNKAIQAKNNSDIIYYGNKLFKNSGYNVFIQETDYNNLTELFNESAYYTVMISYASENNYLKNKYISALLEKGLVIQARDFARSETGRVNSPLFEIKRDLPFFYSSFKNSEIENTDLILLESYYKKVKEQLIYQTGEALINLSGTETTSMAYVKLKLQMLNLRLIECADVFMNKGITTIGESMTFNEQKVAAQSAVSELSKANNLIDKGTVNWF